MGFPTAARVVEKLVASGVLTEITGRQRDRMFMARGIVEVVENPLPAPGKDGLTVSGVLQRGRGGGRNLFSCAPEPRPDTTCGQAGRGLYGRRGRRGV